MGTVIRCENIDLESLPKNQISFLRIVTIANGVGDLISIPAIVIKGKYEGKTIGITAAIHGNELNGVSVIHRIIKHIKPSQLHGTIIGVPVLNIPGFLLGQREFNDGRDLNRVMPGKKRGKPAEQYAYQIREKLLKKFNYLIDLHTASFGRINTFYVRADLTSRLQRAMSLLMNPQIIVHNNSNDGTFRNTASALNIPAITVEVGNPHIFQERLIESSTNGVMQILSYLEFLKDLEITENASPVICSRSYWMHTKKGGLLEVAPKLADHVEKDQLIAVQSDLFGKTIHKYKSLEGGIIVGKSINPVAQAGDRILHLGIIEDVPEESSPNMEKSMESNPGN
ncbi:MAG: succinylglutamate desuccinylase/aspartoacylase family protein [Oligoflexales bacterium]